MDVPSNAELNVIREEEKAIQAAALASMEVERIKSSWNAKINEEVKDIQPLAALNLQTIKSAATWEGMREHVPLQNEINKILSSTDLTEKVEKLETLRNDWGESSQWLAKAGLLRYSTKFTPEMEAEYSKMYSKNAKLTREYFPLSAEVNQIKSNAGWQARENLAKMVVQAKEEYNKIISQENPELKAVEEKVESILKEVPTLKDEKILQDWIQQH